MYIINWHFTFDSFATIFHTLEKQYFFLTCYLNSAFSGRLSMWFKKKKTWNYISITGTGVLQCLGLPGLSSWACLPGGFWVCDPWEWGVQQGWVIWPRSLGPLAWWVMDSWDPCGGVWCGRITWPGSLGLPARTGRLQWTIQSSGWQALIHM